MGNSIINIHACTFIIIMTTCSAEEEADAKGKNCEDMTTGSSHVAKKDVVKKKQQHKGRLKSRVVKGKGKISEARLKSYGL